MSIPVTVTVNIPALADLVSYLRQSAAQQQQIDTLTAEVQHLTSRLRQSTGTLQGAVSKEQQ